MPQCQVSEESICEGVNLNYNSIHNDLSDIKKCLEGTVKTSDLECLVKQADIKTIVTGIVDQLLTKFEQNFDCKLKQVTGKLQDQIDALMIDNENLRERVRSKDRVIESLGEQFNDVKHRSNEAMKLANYNEQYSRKHNIRMLNYPEKNGENLREEFVSLVKKDLKLSIDENDVLAIHRIPGKNTNTRPVIVKVRNTDVKINIMKKKKSLQKGIKFHDDITQRNLGLMTRLKSSEKFENVWFYNCNVYAKQNEGRRIRFDLFDNVEEKLHEKEVENLYMYL